MANNIVIASDNFASGSLNAGWSTVHLLGGMQVVNIPPFQAEPALAATNCGIIFTGTVFPNDQISEVTVGNLSNAGDGTDYLSLYVRYATAANTGYRADITHTNATNYTLNVYAITTGTPLSIGPIGTGSLTVSPGDVLAFAAVGSCITYYQNGKLLFRIGDTTFASGSPGFFQYAQTTLANSRVASWRGYNTVQQDGIWNKRGVVVPALAADLTNGAAGNQIGIQCHSQVLYEGGAQVLSGTVYKMWIDNKLAIYYLESTDGVAWTRRGANVLNGYCNGAVIKNGSTYYMLTETTGHEGVGPVEVYTSSDGISWSQQNATAIAHGSAGTWEANGVDPPFAIAVAGGTFYALYLGYKTGDPFFSTGLATSTDGINWTKYGSNPVLVGGNLCGMVNVGSTYYSWLQTTPAGRGASGPWFDPAESVRYSTTDFINWVKSSKSVHNSQVFEGLNGVIGYTTISAMIDVGGKAYAYIGCAPGDSVTPVIGQMELAIGPAPIKSIVTQSEDGVQQVASDAFTSGAGDLSPNWTLPTGGTKLKIVAGPYVEPTATSAICQAVYTGATFSADQYSEITVQTLTGTLSQALIYPTVRSSIAALTNYEATISSPSGTSDLAANIEKRVAGSNSQIGPTATCNPQVGDVFRLSVYTGNDGFPVLSLFQNGFLLLQVQDSSSTPITTGNPGIQAYATVAIANAQIASWAGGNANVTPSYAKGIKSFDDEEELQWL